MNKVNQYVLDRDNFSSDEEFANHVGQILFNFAKDGYIATFRYEDMGIYIIEYNHADQSLGAPYPYWLTPEEEERVYYEKNN